MREQVRKLGHIQLTVLITLLAIIFAEILAYITIKIFSFPYLLPSVPVVTFIVTGVITPLLSWHLLKLLFSIDEIEQKMNKLAMYDPMTNLFRRQAFYKNAINLHHALKKSDNLYTVCIIDIDNFKSINDTYGHAYGDKVLIHFGQTFLNTFGQNTILGRIGGEEFALISTMEEEEVLWKMEILHKLISKSIIPYQDRYISYSISVGIFENTKLKDITLNQALSYADNALYRAKTTGKNKSIIFSSQSINILEGHI